MVIPRIWKTLPSVRVPCQCHSAHSTPTVLGLGEQFRPDVGNLAKQGGPVLPHLIGPVELSPGMGRLHTVVPVVEAGHEGVDVMRVDRCAEPVGQHAHSVRPAAAYEEVLSLEPRRFHDHLRLWPRPWRARPPGRARRNAGAVAAEAAVPRRSGDLADHAAIGDATPRADVDTAEVTPRWSYRDLGGRS